MRRTILGTLTAASAALLLAACTTTPEQAATAGEGQQPGTNAGAQTQSQSTSSTVSASLAAGKSIPADRTIYFDYDRFDIKQDYRPVVEAHAKYLQDNPDAKILIQGSADERGSREYNLGLGQRRSDSMKKTLLLLGAKENQIEAVSLGEEKPACAAHAEDCWWKNRRDDIRYKVEH